MLLATSTSTIPSFAVSIGAALGLKATCRGPMTGDALTGEPSVRPDAACDIVCGMAGEAVIGGV